MISIKTDLGDVPAGIEQMLGEDLPFTIARFLTMQAQSGQLAAQEGERRVFKLRNDWTTRNTKITPATKKTLMSEVFTDTSNRKSGAGDYLPRQDDGGERIPLAGHNFLAIPTKYLRRLAPGIVPGALRPKSLLPAGANLGQEYTGKFGRMGKAATPYPRTRRQHEALSNGTFVAFVQKSKGGTLCIFVRHGGMGYRGGNSDAEPFYTLVTHATIKPRFPMEQLVQAALDANGEKNFDRAAAEVLVSGALRSGLQVRF